jgi:drug/metabolite transporter (DMT)-like permease
MVTSGSYQSVKLAAPLAGLCLLVNAFVWGTAWWPFRLLEQRGLHALFATAIIYGVACAMILLWRPQTIKQLLSRPNLLWLALGSGMTNATFNWAVTLGDVVRVVLLFYLMPIWSSLLARWLLKEPIKLSALIRIALAIAGAVLVLGKGEIAIPLPNTLVDFLSILGGMSFALNNVLLRKFGHEPENVRAFSMFFGGIVCAGCAALLLASLGKIDLPPVQQLSWLLPCLLLTAAFLLGNLCLQWGAANLPASVTAVVLLSEVLFAAVSSWLAGVQQLTPALMLGGALIVAASLLAVFEPAQTNKS